MKRRPAILRMHPPQPAVRQAGFSLVEVTVAIAIFAFVIVGILGLFPVALKQSSDSALETRAAMVAKQLFESIDSSASAGRIYLPPLVIMGEEDPNLRQQPVGNFPVTLHVGSSGTAALRVVNGDDDWTNGTNEEGADALARVRIEPVSDQIPDLFLATLEFGRPAALPESRRRNFIFSKFVYLP